MSNTRRPDVQSGLEQYIQSIEPRVTEQQFQVVPGGIGNTGSRLESLAKALTGFGGSLGNFLNKQASEASKSAAKNCNKRVKQGAKNAKEKPKKQTQADRELDELLRALGQDDPAAKAVEGGAQDLGDSQIDAVISRGQVESGKAQVPITDEETKQTFDATTLPVNDLAQVQNQEEFRQAVDAGVIAPGENPQLDLARRRSRTITDLASLEASFKEDLSSLAEPDVPVDQAKGIIEDRFRQLVNNYKDNPMYLRSIAGKVNTARRRVLKNLYKERADNVVYQSRLQLAAEGTDYINSFVKEGQSAEAFTASQKAFIDRLRRSGVQKPNEYYVKDIVIPALNEVADDDIDQAMTALDAIEQIDLTGTGAFLGKIGFLEDPLDKVRLDLSRRQEALQAVEPLVQRDKDVTEKAAKHEILTNINNALFASEAEPQKRDQFINAVLDEVQAKYGGTVFLGTLKRFAKDNVARAYDDLAEDPNDLSQQAIEEYIVNNDIVNGKNKLVELYEQREVTPAQFIKLNKELDNADLGFSIVKDGGYQKKITDMQDKAYDMIQSADLPMEQKIGLADKVNSFIRSWDVAFRDQVTKQYQQSGESLKVFKDFFVLKDAYDEFKKENQQLLDAFIKSLDKAPPKQ